MSFNHLNRRTHLYLALALLPWVFMYGISSIPISHSKLLENFYDDGVSQWTETFRMTYNREFPEDMNLREVGAVILEDAGIQRGRFETERYQPNKINVHMWNFWSSTRLTYDLKKRELYTEDRRFRWDHFLIGMHARGGYQHDLLLDDLWAVVVDIVCLTMLVWMISGIIMWWRLNAHRTWGWIALGGGVLVFIGFLMGL